MKYIILALISIAVFYTNPSWGQKKSKTPSAAEKAYKDGDFYEAANIYRAVFSQSNSKLSGAKKAMHQYYYAESCRKTYNFTRAQEYYGLVAKSEFEDNYPEVDYYYAYCLKHNGLYEEAIKYFKIFRRKKVRGIEMTYMQLEAEHELRGCYLAMELIKEPDTLTRIEHMSEDVNTKYSDFSPHLVGDKLYYSSLRFERELVRGRVVGRGQTLVGKLMIADNRGMSRFEQSKSKSLNTKYENSGNSNLNTDGSKLYFTKCSYDNVKEKMICEIYSSHNMGNDVWDEAIKLPEHINVEGVTNTHPAIGFDSSKNREILFFVSEREGGKGKKDIWSAEILGDNEFSDPVNLGDGINTMGDEVSPFFHNSSQALFYSSNHHPGFGGFDIFRTDYENGIYAESINLGIPLNSAANDLYFIINNDDTTGFFASNRPGSQILTGESCCNDIYALRLPQIPPVEMKEMPELPDVSVNTIDLDTVVQEVIEEVAIAEEPTEVAEEVLPEATKVTLDDLNALLPLSLYFHNNEPRNASTSYTKTYDDYIKRIGEYKKEHLPQYNKSVRDEIAQNIEDFFNYDVKANYDKMHLFFDELIVAMQNGFKLAVAIQGYTSPRASVEYNKILAHKRILSVSKDMLEYKDGALKTYLDSGQLMVEELPLGEGKAPMGISDAIDDPRNSIYSVEASSQRKVNFIVVHLQ